jgi:hypothetical protein
MIPWLKKAVPAPLKRRLRAVDRNRNFVRCVRALRRGTLPGPKELAGLSEAWDNDGFMADTAYLGKVCELAAATRGPVLECGSGLTTVLLSVFAGGRGIKVHALEHAVEWRNRVQIMLERCELPGARVELCRLREYEGFDWYELPKETPSGVRLVICDGPPGDTRGGRYGLLPVCADRFADDCTILLDDAERPGERSVTQRWQKDFGTVTEIVETAAGEFAVIKLHAKSCAS